MFKNFIKIKNDKNRGFVLLMASLLAGTFLVIGASIFLISIKELMLSSGGKESQFAFYAADSGIECALYWDIKAGAFATSTYSNEPSSIYCNTQDITVGWDWGLNSSVTAPNTDNNKGQTIFSFDIFPDTSRRDCVEVVVTKTLVDTRIEARGYNTCDITNSRRVERGLRITLTN